MDIDITIFPAIFILCAGLIVFPWGSVLTLRNVILKRHGRRAVAALTKVKRVRQYRRGETFYAVATWKDEDGRECRKTIKSNGDYLLRHINKPLAMDVIYYNDHHVMLADDTWNRAYAVLTLVIGLVFIALGVGAVFWQTHNL